MRAANESIFMKPTYVPWGVSRKKIGPRTVIHGVIHGAIRRTAAVLAVLSALSACANPYLDSRREAGKTNPVGASTPDMIAICFAPSKTARSAVLAMAQPECAKTGRVAAYDHEAPWSCTLLAPTRAFYRCSAKP
jgi:hypothetical protein